MSERVACAIDCDFGFWPTSVMIASAERTDQLKTATDLEFRLKAAVDNWLKDTVEGQSAYEQSPAFNVGDLVQQVESQSLVEQLAEQGVTQFTLSAPVQLVGWQHKEELFHEAI